MVAPFTFLIYLQHGGVISHEFCHASSCLRAFITVVGFFICEWPHLEKSHIALFLLCNKITVHIEFSWTSNLTSPGGVHVKKGTNDPRRWRVLSRCLLIWLLIGLLSPLASVAAGRPKRWQPVKKVEQVHLRDAHDDVPFRVRRHRRGKRTFLHSVDDFISFLLATTDFFLLYYAL